MGLRKQLKHVLQQGRDGVSSCSQLISELRISLFKFLQFICRLSFAIKQLVSQVKVQLQLFLNFASDGFYVLILCKVKHIVQLYAFHGISTTTTNSNLHLTCMIFSFCIVYLLEKMQIFLEEVFDLIIPLTHLNKVNKVLFQLHSERTEGEV